ncbi:transposase [Streptomyces nanhaiensis]|uniref:transposase n=1 Tax=Streptomyces nanhaiensis TaxID=679319 RepID=UPI00399C57E0
MLTAGIAGKKESRRRRSFTPGLKAEVAELCRRRDLSVGQVAKSLDLTETTVRGRTKETEVGSSKRESLTTTPLAPVKPEQTQPTTHQTDWQRNRDRRQAAVVVLKPRYCDERTTRGMDISDLGALVITRRSGNEPITIGDAAVGTLGEFWSWACSDLANNTMRGVLAEYLVATALGAAAGTRTEWDTVDIRTPEGWRVEVKSAAYLQSWTQSRLSDISFSIAPASGWDAQTGTASADVLRRSDVYVFCLLHHQDKQTLNPLNLDQWTFHVLPTRVLDEQCPGQRTIRLSSLGFLSPLKTSFGGLHEAVAACADSIHGS